MDRNNAARTCVVCDAGPVIHLDELGHLALLNDFAQIILPRIVVNEVSRYRPHIFQRSEMRFSIVTPLPTRNPQLLSLCQTFALHRGEIDALTLLNDLPHVLFLTDDSAARLVAQRMGYGVHGTIGVLIRAIRRNMMTPTDVIAALNSIPQQSSLHIKASLLEEIVLRLRKEFR